MCVNAGINVNRPALVRFADKLALLDSAERKPPKLAQTSTHSTNGVTSFDTPQPMSYHDIKRREQEITFELGGLKIRENELLRELQSLSTPIKS